VALHDYFHLFDVMRATLERRPRAEISRWPAVQDELPSLGSTDTSADGGLLWLASPSDRYLFALVIDPGVELDAGKCQPQLGMQY
jgi:hypothetical protein